MGSKFTPLPMSDRVNERLRLRFGNVSISSTTKPSEQNSSPISLVVSARGDIDLVKVTAAFGQACHTARSFAVVVSHPNLNLRNGSFGFLEIWSASARGFSFVISHESSSGPGLHGRPGFVALKW